MLKKMYKLFMKKKREMNTNRRILRVTTNTLSDGTQSFLFNHFIYSLRRGLFHWNQCLSLLTASGFFYAFSETSSFKSNDK